MFKRTSAWLALAALAGGVGACAVPVPPPPPPPVEVAQSIALPPPPGPQPRGERFGFSAAFDAELKKIGQLSPAEFAARYPAPAYLETFSWDPTTAKFFDRLHVERVKKPGRLDKDPSGRVTEVSPVDLPGYKLTDAELAAFKKNGFVVSERLGGQSFGQLYYDIYQRDLPVFVTSDSVLHAWHRSYDAMLEELELTYLRAALDGLLAAMHDQLPKAKEEYGTEALSGALLDADYFLAVARRLLHAEGTPPGHALDPFGERSAPKAVAVTTKFGQDDRVAKTLDAVAAERMETFDLFGRPRNMDFSQFKPRGHYETRPELRSYFRAMMWCGRTDLRVAGGADATGALSSGRELGAAMVLLDLLRKAGKEDAWRQFDRCVQTFVGHTDSATFDDLARVAAAAKLLSPAALKTDADFQKLADAIASSSAGTQHVTGDVYVNPGGSAKVVLPRSFTVLGQKFVIDSWVTSKTVFDQITWDQQNVQRRVPSGTDVAFAALGNNHVTPNLVERVQSGGHLWRDQKPYQHNLAAARNVLDKLNPKEWHSTIYMQWLQTLRTLSAPADEKMPEAMKTREWAMKQTNTQMASWAQLRHDTILYVKQSHTVSVLCYYPAGFVEPVVPFWTQMGAMASRSADLLQRTPFPDAVQATRTKQVQFLRNFAEQMSKLATIADKQLHQKELNADEKKMLEDVMQIVHERVCGGGVRYTGWYPALFYRGKDDCVKWDALVADVHTDVPAPVIGDPGCVLHQGVGNIDLMVIAVDNGKDRVVYVGPTMSHYEFEMPGVARKSDKEWKTELLDGKFPPRPDYTRGYLIPTADRKPTDPREKQKLLSDD